MTSSINSVIQRHLQQLKSEIEAYSNETELWLVKGDISNSAGNLCLHLCGNLQYFIGAVLGNTGYIRQRDDEFSLKNVPVTDLCSLIDDTMLAVSNTLENLDNDTLKSEYPIQVFGKPMTKEYFLIHLASHLGYHLGQINYHRRILATT